MKCGSQSGRILLSSPFHCCRTTTTFCQYIDFVNPCILLQMFFYCIIICSSHDVGSYGEVYRADWNDTVSNLLLLLLLSTNSVIIAATTTAITIT